MGTLDSSTAEFRSWLCSWAVGPCWRRQITGCGVGSGRVSLLLRILLISLLPGCPDMSSFVPLRLFHHAISAFEPAKHRLIILKL